jgi:hypothetical protein
MGNHAISYTDKKQESKGREGPRGKDRTVVRIYDGCTVRASLREVIVIE